jgi:hypothetical protein
MSNSFDRCEPSGQPTDVEQLDREQSTSVDQLSEIDILRQVIADKGHTIDSLSAFMGGKDRSYINKVLNGDRPMPEGFTDDLPNEVQGEWHARCLDRLGTHYAVPKLTEEEARRQYLAGHINLSMNAPQLPAKSGGQLKVSLDTPRKVVAR